MIEVVVAQRHDLAKGIVGLTLQTPDGKPLPAWDAGAHIDVHLPNDLIRQYSLCSKPDESTYEIAVKLEETSTGGSVYIHNEVKQGDHLKIDGPRNLFAMESQQKHCILIAGGIGITPILTMAEACAAAGKSFELHYCYRYAEEAAYLDRIKQLPAESVKLHSTGGNAPRMNAAEVLAAKSDDTHVYICGSTTFIQAMLDTAEEAGWPESNVHREFFANANVSDEPAGTFEVELAQSGQCFVVPEDKSILEVLEDNDVFIPVACEQGVCGSCVTGLLGGEAVHNDAFLTKEEKQSMTKITPCCSRAKSSKLILDL